MKGGISSFRLRISRETLVLRRIRYVPWWRSQVYNPWCLPTVVTHPRSRSFSSRRPGTTLHSSCLLGRVWYYNLYSPPFSTTKSEIPRPRSDTELPSLNIRKASYRGQLDSPRPSLPRRQVLCGLLVRKPSPKTVSVISHSIPSESSLGNILLSPCTY